MGWAVFHFCFIDIVTVTVQKACGMWIVCNVQTECLTWWQCQIKRQDNQSCCKSIRTCFVAKYSAVDKTHPQDRQCHARKSLSHQSYKKLLEQSIKFFGFKFGPNWWTYRQQHYSFPKCILQISSIWHIWTDKIIWLAE